MPKWSFTLWSFTFALSAAVFVAGCNETSQQSSSSSSTTTATTQAAAPSGDPATTAPSTGGKVHKLANGLQYEDLFIGSGTMAEHGMNVSVHYTGRLEDGNKFDSSLDRGQPLKFQLGAHQMIAGMEEGVKGMRIGGKRKITIPPDMGYGASGRGDVIPPNATLVFDVELLDVK